MWVYENNPPHGGNSARLWVGLYHIAPSVDYFHMTAVYRVLVLTYIPVSLSFAIMINWFLLLGSALCPALLMASEPIPPQTSPGLQDQERADS